MSDVVKTADFVQFAPVIFVASWACLVLLISALGAGKSLRLGPVSILGVIVGLADEFQIPVRYVGVGEGIDDLREFHAREFVGAIFEED